MIETLTGKKYIGEILGKKIFINLDYVLRLKGDKHQIIIAEKGIGRLFVFLSIILLLASVVLFFLAGNFQFKRVLNPSTFTEFLPYLSLILYLYGLYLRRDRNNFDEDIQEKFKFTKLEDKIDLEKYLSSEIITQIDACHFRDRDKFLHTFTEYIINKKDNRALIEKRLGINTLKINENLDIYLSKFPNTLDAICEKFFLNSFVAAQQLEAEFIDTKVFLFVLLKTFLRPKMLDLGVNDSEVESLLIWQRNENKKNKYFEKWQKLSKIKPIGNVNKSYTSKITPLLNIMGDDLTKLAAKGRFTTSLGKESEIVQTFQVLQKETGNSSILLIGDPGVGKSRFINYMATRMVVEDVPKSVQDFRLISLDLGKILTKSKEIEVFKTNLQKMFEETKSSGHIILVLEDLPQILTIREDAKFEVVNLIINNINEANVKVIATSSIEDYNRLIRPVKSLASIFDVITLKEPAPNIALQILIDEVPALEKKYDLNIQINSLKRIIDFSSKFNYERVLPDKGLDLLNECCVRAKNKALNHLDNLVVDEVLREKTGGNVGSVTQEEATLLKTLEDKLHERVIGQDEAVKSIALAIRRSRAGISSSNRPVASFLFFGPTGVGKTELAKTLADVYYGSEKLMIRVDMSEYQEESNLTRLIGYSDSKGNFTGGYLTDAVRSRPYSLILLDEVEKANKKVLDLFLQVLDDGFLTDGIGRKIDFANTIIIMTSNVASKEIAELILKGYKYNDVYKEVLEDLRREFRLEFLNRFDKVIMFKPLNIHEVKEIIQILLGKIKENLLNKGISLEWNEATLDKLAEKSYNEIYGAREIRRVLQEEVEDRLASLIIEGNLKSGGDIKFDGLNLIKEI